ncbi:hypothetical protein SAMN05192583_2437 [Sphingomonas gellani]|uniref:Uncharacterized protein n=1 Tax=Sphingomonas gellani TaxID=1166340 RepID=A0A1H8F6X6_9SPHN|nr:hypothetical protein [Sphingomonas gellani]SEN27370.1 hypothetical protein SAMN05192583_2437 [Sphingomonas gellani]
MADKPSSAGGGAFIAFGAIGGAAIGFALDQTTIGFFAGIALGIAASLLIWRSGRR